MEEKRKVPFDISLNKTLKDRFSFTFEVPKAGIYFIEITASAKNKKQNIYPRWLWKLPLPVLSIFGKDDDDLYVRIDGREFPKLGGVRGLYDAPAAWSGTSLKNTSKTNIVILFLEKGAHTLVFHPDETPTLRRIRCEKLETTQRLRYPLRYNNPPERKERSSWYTFTLVDLPLIQFDITGTVEKRKKWLFFTEGDDIKIVLDGEIQKNDKPKAHKNWFFCARAQTGSDSFTSQLGWRSGLHYIELFADWTPTLEEISFNFAQSYKSHQRFDYSRFDREIFDAVSFWNTFFLKQKYPPLDPLDPNLVKAIVYRESKLGYYPDENITDVMQVWDPRNPARSTLLDETPESEFITPDEIGYISYSYPKDRTPPRVESQEESIFWGVRWLYHKAQYLPNLAKPYVRRWRSWREAVWNYNANRELVEEYVHEVFSIYEKGIDFEGNVLWEK